MAARGARAAAGVQRKDDETVVFSWIVWPSKEARKAALDKVMADPRMKPEVNPMPFDGKRMIYGGFEPRRHPRGGTAPQADQFRDAAFARSAVLRRGLADKDERLPGFIDWLKKQFPLRKDLHKSLVRRR